MRVIICAGGTGGHIYPAVSLIHKIWDKNPDSEILYIGTKDRMESKIIPSLNIRYVGIDMEGLSRKNIFHNVIVLKKYLFACKNAKKIISDFHPDVVVGVGGYITAPVISSAHKLGIPTVIHEQNSYPGLTNRRLANIASKILVSLPESMKFFPEEKCVYTGNPRSEEILSSPPIPKSTLGFHENKNLVVIVMGSLGSYTINTEEVKMVGEFKNKDYEVLLITGEAYYDDYKGLEIPSNVKVMAFVDNLMQILKSADLIVSRAGASTISEITAIGLPAILVPSPYVTNNHQYKNALELQNKGACIILPEKEFKSSEVASLIDKTIHNPSLLRDMSLKSKTFCVPNSATLMYNEINELVRND